MARFLAVDWDQNQLHVVAAEIRGTTVQIRRAAVWQESAIPNPAQAEDLGKLLRERLREANIAPAPVLVCLGRDRLIVKEIRYPSVPDSEEPAVVRFQTVKELTDAVEDVVIDYVVTHNPVEGERKAAALVVRKEILGTWKSLCEAGGLRLQALTPRLLGTMACLRTVMGTTVVTPAPEPPDGVICIVTVAEKQAEISIVKGDTPMLSRAVISGPNLVSEIRRNLAVHGGQQPHSPVCAVYLAGKGSGELRDRLAELIEIPVHTFDPFAGAETPDLPTGNRGTFAGAVGLLHAKGRGELPANFVSPRQPKQTANPHLRWVRLGLVGGVFLIVDLLLLGRVLYATWESDLLEVERTREQTEKDLVDVKENGKRLKGIEDWDTPSWLDELYALNTRIPDVNNLRLTSIATEPLARNAKTRAVAKATLKGKLLGKTSSRQPLDQLVSQLGKAGFYSTDPPKVVKDEFTLVMYLERRGPADYNEVLSPDDPTKPKPKVTDTKTSKEKEKTGTKTKTKSGTKN